MSHEYRDYRYELDSSIWYWQLSVRHSHIYYSRICLQAVQKTDATVKFRQQQEYGSNSSSGIHCVFNFHQATGTVNARYVAVQELLSPTHDIAPG